MVTRRCSLWLLGVAALALAATSCAHQTAGYASAGGYMPLNDVDCLGGDDVYVSGSSPCYGFRYGDIEQYPKFTPLTPREVTLSSQRHRSTHVVPRPGFDSPSTFDSSSSPSQTTSMAPSAPAPSMPRMDPVAVSPPSSPPTVVSRPN